MMSAAEPKSTWPDLKCNEEEPKYVNSEDIIAVSSDSSVGHIDLKDLSQSEESSPDVHDLITAVENCDKEVSNEGDDNPYYTPSIEYTPEEEARVIRILDSRLFTWVLLTTFVLNMDRTNISNAISDNMPSDLGFDINVVNTSTAVYSVLFSVTCLTGAVVAKLAGPAQCEFCGQSS